MNGPIRRTALVLLAGFLVLVADVTYWQALAADRLRDHPLNTRTLLTRTGRERGLIISAEGRTLADSVSDPDDVRLFRRRYPEGDLYAHTVGFSSLLFGDSGLEEAYAEELVSGRDFTVSGVLNALLGQDLRSRSLQLTLHHGLTRTAADALAGRRGAVAALHPRTGAVLALLSSPRFDPNDLLGPEAAGAWEELEGDPSRPLLDRAAARAYPPGSVFHAVTAAAALELGIVSADFRFPNPPAPGEPSCAPSERGEITLEEAFVLSCVAAFDRLGRMTGGAALAEAAERFGWGRAPPLDIPALASSLSPDPQAPTQLALGEEGAEATALQMALLAAAVANEGLLMEPQLVARIFDADGAVGYELAPAVYSEAVGASAALTTAAMMERAVARGTGVRARIPGVRVAGVAGAGESGNWFIGFAPADAPVIAVAVITEPGGGEEGAVPGGSEAAPVAARVMEYWLRGRPG